MYFFFYFKIIEKNVVTYIPSYDFNVIFYQRTNFPCGPIFHKVDIGTGVANSDSF